MTLKLGHNENKEFPIMTRRIFTKFDYIILALGWLFLILFTIISAIYTNSKGLLFTQVYDYMTQHVPLLDNLRNQFYQTGKIIPEFMPNLGGGQNAFNYVYYGLANPLIMPSYFLPFISSYNYLLGIMTLTILAVFTLTHFWLRKRFSVLISAVGSLAILLAPAILFSHHNEYMYIDYMPFLILAFHGIDKIIYKNKYLGFIIAGFLIGLTSFYFLPACFAAMGIYFIYVYLERISSNKKQSFKIREFLQLAGKTVFGLLISLGLIMFIFLPTAIASMQGRISTKTVYSLQDLLMPNLYFLGNNHGIDFMVENTPLGYCTIGVVFVVLLVFSKAKKNIVTSILFIIISIFPIFNYLLNMSYYIDLRATLPLLPLFSLLLAEFFEFANSFLLKRKLFIKVPLIKKIKVPLIKKSFLSILGIVLIMSISVPALQKTLPTMDKRYTYKNFNIAEKLNVEADQVLGAYNDNSNNDNGNSDNSNSDNSNINDIYRSTYIADGAAKRPNNLLSSNYFTNSIYTSSNNINWSNYMRHELWSIPGLAFMPWFLKNTDSVFENTTLGVKYIFTMPSDLSYSSKIDIESFQNKKLSSLGYQKISSHIWENKAAFSIGYATNNIFSDISQMDEMYSKAAITQGISVNGSQTRLPNIDKFKKINLNNMFNYYNKSSDALIINEKDNHEFDYKLPRKLHNELLFIKLKFNDSVVQNGEQERNMTINDITNGFNFRKQYQTKDREFRYIIQPIDQDLENLKIRVTSGYWPIESIEAFTMPLADLQAAKQKFDQMNVTKFNTDGLEGNINITRPNSVLALSLGYDPGFTLKVDGKEQPIFMANGGIIGSNISSGFHNIELTYKAPYYRLGIIISFITLFGLLAYYFIVRRRVV
ncbi:MAG: YfhO family protein [Bifidobacteriaceae bacterium]|jgi:uncharacterized membrane protein YfhO|nr:YfhO family protein [Bifidobacteriaceae bacterium]